MNNTAILLSSLLALIGSSSSKYGENFSRSYAIWPNQQDSHRTTTPSRFNSRLSKQFEPIDDESVRKFAIIANNHNPISRDHQFRILPLGARTTLSIPMTITSNQPNNNNNNNQNYVYEQNHNKEKYYTSQHSDINSLNANTQTNNNIHSKPGEKLSSKLKTPVTNIATSTATAPTSDVNHGITVLDPLPTSTEATTTTISSNYMENNENNTNLQQAQLYQSSPYQLLPQEISRKHMVTFSLDKSVPVGPPASGLTQIIVVKGAGLNGKPVTIMRRQPTPKIDHLYHNNENNYNNNINNNHNNNINYNHNNNDNNNYNYNNLNNSPIEQHSLNPLAINSTNTKATTSAHANTQANNKVQIASSESPQILQTTTPQPASQWVQLEPSTLNPLETSMQGIEQAIGFLPSTSNQQDLTQQPDLKIKLYPITQQQQQQQTVHLITSKTPTTPTTTSDGQSVRLIHKKHNKFDDNIVSHTITVVDNHAFRLPPNATSVHNNKLIVAMKPGRPRRRPQHPATTQFPVYNIVAGMTPPYGPPPTAYPTRSPAPMPGYGLITIKPGSTTTASSNANPANDGQTDLATQQSTSNGQSTSPTMTPFGAQNIKFPAQVPSSLQINDNQQTATPTNLIENINISTPLNEPGLLFGDQQGSDSSTTTTHHQVHKVPQKIHMETDEQIVRPPPNHIIISDESTTNYFHITTTRKPTKPTPTKKINIVSANTTLVTTNPDELHDVLNHFIAESHHNHQKPHYLGNQRPSKKPGIFEFMSNLINSGLTTSTLAIITLVKTLFMSLFVLLLPPIALTVGILQAVQG